MVTRYENKLRWWRLISFGIVCCRFEVRMTPIEKARTLLADASPELRRAKDLVHE